MTFSVKGEGALDSLSGLADNMRIGIAQGAEMAGQVLVRQAQAGITSPPKSGRVYGSHQASAPGEYSANKSGDLLNSIDYNVSGADYLAFFATAEHAGYQEDGTSKMEQRPNLANAINDQGDNLVSLIEQVVWRRIA